MTTNSNDLVPRTGTFPMPGMEGDANAPRKVKVNAQAVVLVIILGVSAAALASMRHIGIKSGIDFNNGSKTPVQPAAAQDEPEKAARYDRIMKDLQQLQTPLDIALGELAKIPALIPTDQKVAKPFEEIRPTGPSDEDNKKSSDMARIAASREAAKKLELQSVMGGKVPLARIDGKFYRIGDLVNEKFIVRAIDHRSVVVEANGETFEVEMKVGKAGSSPKKR
jgi:hypothetical protein